MPSVVPPPPRFSTTKVWPSCRPTCSNTVRAVMSVALPAENGMTILIGCLVGHSCAVAVSGTISAIVASAWTYKRDMDSSPCAAA
jgi:hypothetical protein